MGYCFEVLKTYTVDLSILTMVGKPNRKEAYEES